MLRNSHHTDAAALPRWVWRGTLLGVALVVTAVVVVAVAIRLGVADPPVAGPVVWEDTAFAWAGGAQQTLAVRDMTWATAPEAVPTAADTAFTLRVRARLDSDAGPLAAWGVWIAGADRARTLYAISASGYWTIRTCAPGTMPQRIEDCPAADPEWRWRLFPRIHPPGTANTLVLHREPDGAVRLRVNAERLGAPYVAPGGAWGIWARGGKAASGIVWQRAALAMLQ